MSERTRPQLTVKELIRFLQQCNPDAKVFTAVSLLNVDEPPETQEFIDWENQARCVAVEATSPVKDCEEVTIGYELIV